MVNLAMREMNRMWRVEGHDADVGMAKTLCQKGEFSKHFGEEIDEYRAHFGGRIFDWVNPMSFFVNVPWAILAFFSGVAALIYQTLWVKALKLSLSGRTPLGKAFSVTNNEARRIQ
jgi:hypothetical protein